MKTTLTISTVGLLLLQLLLLALPLLSNANYVFFYRFLLL
jgi:hypothetical protein